MDSMQDMSLFVAGDFLAADHSLPSSPLFEDGLGSVWNLDGSGGAGYISPTYIKPKVADYKTIHVADDGIGNELDVDQSPSAGLLNGFGSSWYETKLDLLDYLTGDNPEVIEDQTTPANRLLGEDPVIVQAQSAHAINILASIAEETSQQLSLSKPPTVSDIKDEGPGLPAGTLLDFLSEGIDPIVANDVSYVNPLSPMSTEDLDDLLSSGPSSPDITQQSSVSPHQFVFSQSPPQSSLLEEKLPSDIVEFLDSVSEFSSPAHSPEYCSSDPDYTPQFEAPTRTPVCSAATTKRKRSKPYSRVPKTAASEEARLSERKQRKKQQNRDAATRYRQKKKLESGEVDTECQELLDRNTELTEKVDHLAKEIGYLKDLLAEVFHVRKIKM